MNKENNENEMNGNKDYYEEGADSCHLRRSLT